jgi:hypothetical protein
VRPAAENQVKTAMAAVGLHTNAAAVAPIGSGKALAVDGEIEPALSCWVRVSAALTILALRGHQRRRRRGPRAWRCAIRHAMPAIRALPALYAADVSMSWVVTAVLIWFCRNGD